MDHDHRGTRLSVLRSAGEPSGPDCTHHRIGLRRDNAAERDDATTPRAATTPSGGCADIWDVASWSAEPHRTYRFNTSFRHDDGATVTASGRVGGPAATADLGAALRPFEHLGCPIVVDVCHAVLGADAVLTLVEVGLRHITVGGQSFAIAHADLESRRRIAAAGGRLLLRPPCPRAAADRRAS